LNYHAPDCEIAHSVEEALKIAKGSEGGSDKIFVFGGSEIYKLFLDKTDTLMLTLVDSKKEGTHKFPDFSENFIKTTSFGTHEFEGETFEWVDYVRK